MNPDLILCGSLALIHTGTMDDRPVGDIDFVINKKRLNDNTTNIYGFYIDHYDQEDNNYDSWHGRADGYTVNVLAFNDDIKLEKRLRDGVWVQDTETILHYKTKYNRDNDKKDLENIANKCLEDWITEE